MGGFTYIFWRESKNTNNIKCIYLIENFTTPALFKEHCVKIFCMEYNEVFQEMCKVGVENHLHSQIKY